MGARDNIRNVWPHLILDLREIKESKVTVPIKEDGCAYLSCAMCQPHTVRCAMWLQTTEHGVGGGGGETIDIVAKYTQVPKLVNLFLSVDTTFTDCRKGQRSHLSLNRFIFGRLSSDADLHFSMTTIAKDRRQQGSKQHHHTLFQ